MGRWVRGWIVVSLLAFGACDDPVTPTDAGGGTDAGAVDAGSGLEGTEIPGLDGPVEVIYDDRGIPHIYASTVHDLMVVEGYVMSRDRFVQMELIRRGVTGRLAEVLGGLLEGDDLEALVRDDEGARYLGYARQGQAIYDSFADDDETKLMADAFVAGINAYIDQELNGGDYVPSRGNELINIIASSPNFTPWSGADIFALARYQAGNLSYDAGADIGRTRSLRGVAAAFDPAHADPRRVARAGIYDDFWSERQARDVYTMDDFNDGSSSAVRPSVSQPRPRTDARATLSMATLERSERFFERLAERNPYVRGEAEHIGSNSWVVSGTHTESGFPILSNDPHLSLISPGVWWYVHLNTARMGGERMIDAEGVAFAGLPGVVLGFNRDIAWSATTTGYDVTDVYAEQVTFRNDGTMDAPDWTPVSVTFMGSQVDLTVLTETVTVGTEDRPYEIYVVPHHGPVVPSSWQEPETAVAMGETALGQAMSVRYTGDDVSNELLFFTDLLTASTMDEAFAAADAFEVGSQNFSFATRTGDIGWTTQARIPTREVCTHALDADGTPVASVASNPTNGLAESPLFVLSGMGGYEWNGNLSAAFIPHAINPLSGYIATANQANVPVTQDGNPCNDAHYLGGDFAVGYRQARIVQRLDELIARGDITTDDMITLQAETRSSLGETTRDALVASLDHALGVTDDDVALNAVVTAATSDQMDDLRAARDRLATWTFSTPHGVGATASAEIAESVATTIFNATITRLTGLAFNDEAALIGSGPGSGDRARLIEWILMTPEEQQAIPVRTYRDDYQVRTDATLTGWNDSVLWDEITTDGIETRDERVTSAVLDALAWLETELGSDWDQWRWGRLHTVRFEQLVQPTVTGEVVSIPPEGDATFPNGFPRHGDYGAVDVGNFGMWPGTRFSHGSGASQRLVVEMTPDGPLAFNALPGGQSEDPDDPHHADEAELWRNNEQPPLYFDLEDIQAHTEETVTFIPGS